MGLSMPCLISLPLVFVSVRQQNNRAMRQQIRELGEHYPRWRRVRGDGNCYYRAVMFGLVERSLADAQVMQALIKILENIDLTGK